MRAVLRDIEKPPEGWRYTIPENGVLIKADFFEELWKKVLRHRHANSLPIPEDYREFLENAACEETSPPGSRCGAPRRKPRESRPIQHLMISHVERFLSTVWAAIVDRKFVSRDTALERVSVCIGCPLRATMPGGCGGCYTLLKKAKALLDKNGAIEIPPDEDGLVRDVCGACGCFIPLKVALENSTLNKAEGSHRPAYWSECWRNNS
jgi:hypothetical protein